MSTATASAIAPLPLHSASEDSPVELEGDRAAEDVETVETSRRSGSGAHDRSSGSSSANRPRRAFTADELDILLGSGNYSDIARDAKPTLSVSHVSRVLRGLSKPSLDVARRIANAAGVTLDDLQPWLERRQASPVPSSRPRSFKPIVNPNAKLDIDKAREIRARVAEGDVSLEELAEEFGVTKQAISDVVRGISYPVDS